MKIDRGVHHIMHKMRLADSNKRKILIRWAKEVLNEERPPKGDKDEFLHRISTKAQNQFKEFKKYVNKVKADYPKMTPKGDPYSDWYDQASMDGSLAYNNSADDF